MKEQLLEVKLSEWFTVESQESFFVRVSGRDVSAPALKRAFHYGQTSLNFNLAQALSLGELSEAHYSKLQAMGFKLPEEGPLWLTPCVSAGSDRVPLLSLLLWLLGQRISGFKWELVPAPLKLFGGVLGESDLAALESS